MWKLTIPNDVLEQLRCSFCNEHLSQLPVYLYPDHKGACCGRCPVLSDQNPIRNASYEAVAMYLFFPCRFKTFGCIEQVLPSQMLTHEQSCNYKQYFCPLIPLGSCTWQGPASELYRHYEDQHKVLTLQENKCHFEVDLINMYEDNYLLMHNGDLFIVHIKCDARENLFWSSVRYIGNKKVAQQYCYQIELKAPNNFERIQLAKKVVECDISMSIDKDVAVNINTNEIKSKLGNPCSIICFVCLSANITAADLLIDLISPSTTIATSNVDEDILHELECPVCNEYMVPPIHQCVSGHSICNTCKPQIKECPTCRNAIQETRNYSLEKLTLLIKYGCKFREYGCNFVSTSENIRNHEDSCKHGPYDCPFQGYNDCKWNGRLCDIMQHCKSQHEDNIMNVDIITFPFVDDGHDEPDDDCFVNNIHGNAFRLIFKYEEDTFFWSLQYIGPPEESSKFLYEIDIIDNSEDNQRLFIRKKCGPLTKYQDAFNNEKFTICLDIDILRSFIVKKDLIYKCGIFQK